MNIKPNSTMTVSQMQTTFRDMVYSIFQRLLHDKRIKDNPINLARKYTVGELEQVVYSFISGTLYDKEVTFSAYKKLCEFNEKHNQSPNQQLTAFDMSKYERRKTVDI